MLVTSVRPVAHPDRPEAPSSRRLAAVPTLAGDSLKLSAPKVSSRPSKDWRLPDSSGHVMTVPHRYQGEDASCGPSSLWMVLGYHLGKDAVDFKALDRSLRPTGRLTNAVGTTPTALAEAARRFGMAASVTNHADTAQLRRLLDDGLPAILLGTWTDGKDTDLHFVVVNGYDGTDDATTRWHITDPYVAGNGQVVYSTEQLMAFWHCHTGKGLPYPYQRAVVNVAPADHADDLPKDNRSVGLKVIDAAMIAGTNVLRAFDTPKR